MVAVYHLLPPTKARNLLFAAPNHPEVTKRNDKSSLEDLESHYIKLLPYIVLSAIILWGITKICQENKIGEILLYLFYLFFIVQLILLPINYGVFVYSNDFHRIKELILQNEDLQSSIPRSKNHWLLKEYPDSFAIYLGDTQEVLLIQKSQVLGILISGRENIFRRFKSTGMNQHRSGRKSTI